MNEYRRCETWVKLISNIEPDGIVDGLGAVPTNTTSLLKGRGRPKATTNKRKRLYDVSLIATKHEIAITFEEKEPECMKKNKI